MAKNKGPVVLARPEHPLSRSLVDPDVLWVLRKLRSEGFLAYIVGGAVRDILLGREPKDFDVGTDARPSQLKRIFRNSRLIGRRFRIAHIYFRKKGEADKIVEVTTFRGTAQLNGEEEIHPEDADHTGAVFGTPEDDAARRDFTVNALFYDSDNFTIVDYLGGLKDLKAKVIRLIGDPDERYAEDPVRMLRALEFAVRLGFSIEEKTFEGIRKNAGLIATASRARLREEMRQNKERSITGEVLRMAREAGLLAALYPKLGGDADLALHLVSWLDKRQVAGENCEESAYLAAMALPALMEKCPLEPDAPLDRVSELSADIITDIFSDYQYSAHLRHNARELLISLYRICKGKRYRAKGRFTRKPEFAFALELFGELAGRFEGFAAPYAYWKDLLGGKPSAEAGVRKKKRNRRRYRRPRPTGEAAS
ncbi:CCA tRNA nucleotidyltransferase [bacterium]|nr:MAG: CCA tRNA nucleotidyltransferase [bacterium]